MNESEIPPGQLVEAGKDSTIVFHEPEHDFDLAPDLVERPVGVARFDAVGTGRDDGGDVLLAEPFENVVGVIGPVGEERVGVTVTGCLEQRQGLRRVAGLAGGQGEMQRVAEAVDEAVQLAGESAA